MTEATPSIRYYPNYSCVSALNTWIFGDRVALLGDAAHAHGGAFATGGSLAIDDAYALSLAITSVFPISAKRKPTAKDIARALRLYEMTRKPHAERLLKMVHSGNQARLDKFRRGAVETDLQLRARAAKGSNTTWLHEHDVVKAFEDVLKTSREEEEGLESNSARL